LNKTLSGKPGAVQLRCRALLRVLPIGPHLGQSHSLYEDLFTSVRQHPLRALIARNDMRHTKFCRLISVNASHRGIAIDWLANEFRQTVWHGQTKGSGMLQIRIHGRGGQGVVTAAEMLSVAAFEQGSHAQAVPSFGSERTGAPVVSFCRIDDRPIRLREPVLTPDVLIVQDPTLLHQVDVFQGLKPDGYVLINTRRSFDGLGLTEIAGRFRPERLVTLPATEIARKHLGRPLPNAVLLGGFAALTGIITLDAVSHAIGEKFTGEVARRNIAAAAEAFEITKNKMQPPPAAPPAQKEARP
jgi:pyruvate ferredoxin oxidoreductase gamma subunit